MKTSNDVNAPKKWNKNIGKDNLPACARHGDRELILRLAGEGIDLTEFRSKDEETLLFIACKEGNTDTAIALLDVGLDPNARDRRGASILSKICNRGSVVPKPEIVRLLLHRGADPNLHGTLTPAIFDRCGYALPLNGCAIDSFLDCAKELFEWCKSVNQPQPYSLVTPLMCAAHSQPASQRSVEMIQWLVQSGADLAMRSRLGYTAMDFALGASWYKPVQPEWIRAEEVADREVLQFLFESGARPTELFKQVFETAMK